MNTTITILTMVDLSEGSESIPVVKGVYRSNAVARDNAIVLLCGKAAEWGISEDAVDTDNLRVANDFGTRCVQMGLSEVVMECEAKFGVL